MFPSETVVTPVTPRMVMPVMLTEGCDIYKRLSCIRIRVLPLPPTTRNSKPVLGLNHTAGIPPCAIPRLPPPSALLVPPPNHTRLQPLVTKLSRSSCPFGKAFLRSERYTDASSTCSREDVQLTTPPPAEVFGYEAINYGKQDQHQFVVILQFVQHVIRTDNTRTASKQPKPLTRRCV